MTDSEFAAHCEGCQAFGVSTSGTDWSREALADLAQTHLRNCRAEADEIDLVERTDDDEAVVETITAEVTAR